MVSGASSLHVSPLREISQFSAALWSRVKPEPSGGSSVPLQVPRLVGHGQGTNPFLLREPLHVWHPSWPWIYSAGGSLVSPLLASPACPRVAFLTTLSAEEALLMSFQVFSRWKCSERWFGVGGEFQIFAMGPHWPVHFFFLRILSDCGVRVMLGS